jgi:hypothetical protein
MKSAKLLLLTGCVWLLAACNSVGPYHATVYRLDAAVYQVSVNTWTGRRNRPDADDELKRKAESEILAVFQRRGVPVESSAFIEFTPFEGGRVLITFVAGDRNGVARWSALSNDRFDDELRRIGPKPSVFEFEGRLP